MNQFKYLGFFKCFADSRRISKEGPGFERKKNRIKRKKTCRQIICYHKICLQRRHPKKEIL
jgi:hypothetical protein